LGSRFISLLEDVEVQSLAGWTWYSSPHMMASASRTPLAMNVLLYGRLSLRDGGFLNGKKGIANLSLVLIYHSMGDTFTKRILTKCILTKRILYKTYRYTHSAYTHAAYTVTKRILSRTYTEPILPDFLSLVIHTL
jgi:hypothetical protein